MKSFKRCAVKTLSLLLVLSMLASAMLLTASASGAADVKAWTVGASAKAFKQTTGGELGQRIHVGGSFDAFALRMPTFNTKGSSASLSVFAWDTDYDTTVSAEPLASKNFTDLVHNATNRFEMGKTLPAGEYLFLIHNIKGTVGAWGVASRATSLGCVYEKGIPSDSELELTVHFTEAVDTPFVKCVNFVKNTTAVYAYDVSRKTEHNDDRIINTEFGSIVSGTVLEGKLDAAAPGVITAPVHQDRVEWGEAHAHIENFINGGDQIMGQHLNIAGAISGFSICLPTYRQTDVSVTVAAYKWDTDVYTSMKAEPIAARRFTNVKDGQSLWVYFNESMPAGEYLFVATEASGQAGVYRYRDNSVSLGYAIMGNLQYPIDTEMEVLVETGIKNPFLPVETHKDVSTGEATVPEAWKAPEDSLINTHKVQPSTWVFTDGLGRESLTYADVGGLRDDKTLAMFFWDWHYSDGARQEPFNLQDFIAKYPEAKNDMGHSAWPYPVSTINSYYRFFWNESIYGYYNTLDTWVLRRQAEMLANAGVDTVFMDNSNHSWVWQPGYEVVYETWTEAQNDGVNVPKVSYHLPMWQWNGKTEMQLELLYEDIYRVGKYENLWFWFDEKPMIIADWRILDTTDPYIAELDSFFTLRTPIGAYNSAVQTSEKYIKEVDRIKYWDWSSIYPQPAFYADKGDIFSKEAEQISVSVSNNFNYVAGKLIAMNGANVTGRSYTTDYQDRYKKEGDEATKWGYNFAQQFNYALEVDPKVIFVTGYNEWKVAMYEKWQGVSPAFQDQFNDEFSRDIEPSKGALKDHYYYQFVNFARRYLGAEEIPTPSHKATIDLSTGLAGQWEGVEPYFGAYIGNTDDRDHSGWGSTYYSDFSGRNDIIGAKVARDDEFVYFNVECNEDITPYTDKLWMNLYIDTDQENKGWETFDFVVNKTAASEKTSVLEKFTDGYTSEKVADVEYTVDGKFMTVKIAKSDLGLTGDDYTINFAWTDNVHDADDIGVISKDGWVYSEFSGDIMDFYTSGDVAPGARFKFSYISTADNAKIPEGDEDETTNTTEDATDVVTEDTTDAATDVTTEATTDGTVEDTTAEADGGCKSSVALSAIAVLTALGAAVVLKKRD